MIKSKRGRKPKIKPIEEGQEHSTIEPVEHVPKKRGRKPKGGKIIENNSIAEKIVATMPNIVMHLQCTMDDVYTTFNTGESYDPIVFPVENYDDNDDFFKSNFTVLEDNLDKNVLNSKSTNIKRDSIHTFIDIEVDSHSNMTIDSMNKDINDKIAAGVSGIKANIKDIKDIKDSKDSKDNDNNRNRANSRIISQKLRELSHKLHNNISDNKSACFWCTCQFNTGNIYIPKRVQQDNIDVYGCFCSPECATSFLMNENIDSSIRFERYSMINYIYGAIYDYKKNIKPAPDPHYILDKFCGNLSIEEYRQHFTDDNLLMVANKPQSRIFPELFEENNMSSNDMRYSINKFT